MYMVSDNFPIKFLVTGERNKTLITTVVTLLLFIAWVAIGFYVKNNYESLYLESVLVMVILIVMYLIGFYAILNEFPKWFYRKL